MVPCSLANCRNRQAATLIHGQMKERLCLPNQSTTTITNLLHLGHTIRFVSETDFAFVTTSEKSSSACCCATTSLLFRSLAVAPLAPINPVGRSEMRLRGAAPQHRPIGRMLSRAVFTPVNQAGTGVIEFTTKATWRTRGCYLSTTPNHQRCLECLECAVPQCGSSIAAVQAHAHPLHPTQLGTNHWFTSCGPQWLPFCLEMLP
jgi:hypothetical protein